LKNEKPQPLPGLNEGSGWALDIPALLGFGSRNEAQSGSSQPAVSNVNIEQPSRTPALPQPAQVPPGASQPLLPPAAIPSVNGGGGRTGSGPLVIVPEATITRGQVEPSPQIPPQIPQRPIVQPAAPSGQNSNELRPPAAVGEAGQPARPVRQEPPSLLGRLLGGG
jgi:hypothetical protein